MVSGNRQTLVNAGKKAKTTGHRPRTKMSDKQLAIFGTPVEKRALALRKAGKRAPATKRCKKSAKGRSASAGGSREGTNPVGGIITLTLNKGSRKAVNPEKRSTSIMAAAKQSIKKTSSAAQRSGGGRSGKGKTTQKRRNPPRRGRGFTGLATNALFVIVGAVGSRLGTQALLGARNAGFMGYLGNAGAGVGLSMLARWIMKSQEASNAILLGTAVGIVLRVLADFTPLGEYARAAGLGDYQVSNFVTPQRYRDALNSAEVEVPGGWAPQVVPANAGANAGLSAGYGNGNLYTGGGLYT